MRKLIYFDVRGRAEPIRFVLEEIGESWEEQVVTLEDWVSDAPTTPFHRLPVLRDGSFQIPETFAILNYLGRKHGLLGVSSEEHVLCDVVVEAWRDYNQRFTSTLSSGSEPLRKHFFQQQHPQLMGDLETWYSNRESDTEFWAGSLTIADFVAFTSIDDLIQRSPDIVDPYKQLLEFHGAFAARPSVKRWLVSTDRQPALSYLGADGRKLYPSST